ncbi:hypothetical protein HUT18_03245 [Streptomyces sp. NA04227]|uniref:hypothetical protein n=1 Tax=Streptomyces sp. NA04227 TaxID=2742136 RepID=UPI00159199D6|nr:hypothetical protein [Streptomyces sp. NA04227]QKW10616.1 hypothetical protein HUT18_03245 [Streptomyces sp. NA04227]
MLAETVCSAVAVAGLGIAGVTAYRKRFLAAARLVAYSLVPLGLVMTGAVEWAVDTAFSPTAWAGFGVLGGAWLLFTATKALERRGERRAAEAAGPGPDAVAPQAPRSLGRSGKASGRGGSASPKGGSEDFSDIEEILKKHGI